MLVNLAQTSYLRHITRPGTTLTGQFGSYHGGSTSIIIFLFREVLILHLKLLHGDATLHQDSYLLKFPLSRPLKTKFS